MSDFVEYKPMDVEHNVKAAVENLRKAYYSNDAEKVAKIFTEAEGIIVSAICHDTYTVCKPDEEIPKGEWARHDEWVNGIYVGGFYHINCPVIEEGYALYSRWTTRFCPNCGLPMLKGGENNG